MDKDAAEVAGEKKQTESETFNKQVLTAVGTIAAFAFGTFVLGALFDAPWPAAVASCGLSIMGVGVAYFLLRPPRDC
jgi:predicted phage tail protein